MTTPHRYHDDPIEELINQIKAKLYEIWRTTGYGHLEIDSERISKSKIRVILRSGTHIRFVVSDEDLNK